MKSLPTPIDPSSPDTALRVSRYGLAAVITGGFVRNANNYLPSSTLPGLEATEQLARDLTDGELNGYALDGSAAASGAALTFDTVKLPTAFDAANYSVSQQFGNTTTFALGTGSTDFSVGVTHPNGDIGGCTQTIDNLLLNKDGRVSLLRMSPDIGEQCVQPGVNAELDQNFATNTRFLESTLGAVFIVKNNGDVQSWGDANCGVLGNNSSSGRAERPSAVIELKDVTSLKAGEVFALARDKAGSVYTWGSDRDGALGLGSAPGYDLESCDPASGPTFSGDPGANTTPRLVPRLGNIGSVGVDRRTAFAIDTAGRVYQWGSPVTATDETDESQFLREPTQVTAPPGMPPATAIVGADRFAFILTNAGSVYGFGHSPRGVFGDGRTTPVATPTKVPSLEGVVQLAGKMQSGMAAALLRDGKIKVWGGATATPTTPASVRLCLLPNSNATVCLSEVTTPVPPMRHISAAGPHLTFVAKDGIVYFTRSDFGTFYTVKPF